MAKLYYYHGAMGSSKSALLLMKAYSYQERNIPFICLKPSTDTRDGYGIIKSRVGIERSCISVNTNTNLIDVVFKHMKMDSNKSQWVLVDECQFLTADQIDQLIYVVDEVGINVQCFGLRTDFMGKLFEGSKRLMEMADDIEEIKTSCKCGGKAIINARINKNGDVLVEGEQIQIGGDESYTSMCRKYYNRSIKKPCNNFGLVQKL